ncbi:S-ribosylhomocysteine lyase [Acrasis kona]|uniref:S-ribosylhomocysteine lyase n=1 Tax=Acrasis kona TaxID=1008807 RepID=A0AAW2ZNP8_9EUKA
MLHHHQVLFKSPNQKTVKHPDLHMKDSLKTSFNAENILSNDSDAVTNVAEPQTCSHSPSATPTTPIKKRKIICPPAPRKVKKQAKMTFDHNESTCRILNFDDFEVEPRDEQPVLSEAQLTCPFELFVKLNICCSNRRV